MAAQDAPSDSSFSALYRELKAGRITRRDFITRGAALGIALPALLFVVNAVKVDPACATPLVQTPALLSTRPSEGTDRQRRGAGGALKILQWQAATTLSVHSSTEVTDFLAAALVTEPLLSYAQDGSLLPTLVREVPSFENGGLSPDLKTVTYKLLPNVTWSDGKPFTARDVVFTWQWIMDEANQSPDIDGYRPISSVEAIDMWTATVTFAEPTLAWYIPFTSTYGGGIYPKHFWEGVDPQVANEKFRRAPIGTGPYVVESFSENDQTTYKVNDKYREPNKPCFATVTLKGESDATTAARTVLQSGAWDLAWGLQVGLGQVNETILDELAKAGKGHIVVHPGVAVERVLINFSDPNREVDGQRSEMHTPHPFLTDKAVRRALSLATDRQSISTELFSGPPGEPPGRNILTGMPRYDSQNTSWEFNLDKANQVLDEAGWVKDGGIRRKGDVSLKLNYVSPINAVRQQTQAINKRNWERAGFAVTLGQVDPGVYFNDAAGNDQNASHFYRDLEMYTNGPSWPDPLTYLYRWYAGPDGRNIAQKGNGWLGLNEARYRNPEYDRLYERASKEIDPEAAGQLFIRMNDILIDDVIVIPLVQRAAEKFAMVNTLRVGNISPNAWEVLYWNIANWNRVS